MASDRNPLFSFFFNRSSLFQLRLPAGGVGRFLRIQPGEAGLLAWVTLIQAVMSFSSIMANNVAQATFIKRFGAHALPVVFTLEALLTLAMAGLVGIFMERFSKIRVFSGLLLFYGLAIGLIRVLIPTGAALVYPALYILKSQAVGVLPILYWDILSDLFTIRQSKRLYTLISAGGILGTMSGSFMSGSLSAWVGIDNVLILFSLGMGITVLLNEMTEKVIQRPITPRTTPKTQQGTAIREMAGVFADQWRDSPLLMYMVLLIAIPNFILPILDFQFNVMVDRHFASEAGTLGFFAVFRGLSNGLMLASLMVSGRLIDKWGIPVCLLFHPLNYVAAFFVVMLRFDIIAAVYARLSTETLKTVLNNPARAILYNFFPAHRRSTIRLVLRGWVVRISDFSGSGMLILISGIMDPRHLSLLAMPLALVWTLTAFRLRQTYPDLLLSVLKTGQMDWEAVAEDQQRLLARDEASWAALVRGLADPDPSIALLSAQTLSKSRPDQLARQMLPLIWDKPLALQQQWLELLTPSHACVPQLQAIIPGASPQLLPEILAALNRVAPGQVHGLMTPFLDHPDLRVRFRAIMGLGCRSERVAALCRLLEDWAPPHLAEPPNPAADFHGTITRLFSQTQDPDIRAMILEGMAMTGHPLFQNQAAQAATDPDPGIRMAALQGLALGNDPDRASLILPFLKDPDLRIRSLAFDYFKSCGSAALPALLTAISSHSRVMQQQAALLLRSLGIPQAAVSAFIRKRTEAAWAYLCQVKTLSQAPQEPGLHLLSACIQERYQTEIEILIRVLGAVIFGGQDRTILRAVQSRDRSSMDLVIEMLETELHPRLGAALIPLLEDRPLLERITACGRALGYQTLPAQDAAIEVTRLLETETDPWIKALCLYAGPGLWTLEQSPASQYVQDIDPGVAQAAAWAVKDMPGRAAVPDILTHTLFLRQAPLFKTLKTMELLPMALECRLTDLAPDQVLLTSGQDMGKVYLFQKNLVVCQTPGMDRQGTPVSQAVQETGIAGEMPWIDGGPQLYTLVADAPCQVLEIPGPLFAGLLSAHPWLAMDLSRHYSRRIRVYHTIWNQEC